MINLNTLLVILEKEVDIFGKVALWIAIGMFFLPVFVLTMIVCIKTLVKKRRELSTRIKAQNASEASKPVLKTKTSDVDYYAMFGGKDNIVKITKEMTRVSLEIKDLDLVNFDELRSLKIGVLIAGNVVKCSSQELVNYFEEK